MMKKTLLIPGGTGYIGSHAVVVFEQAGYHTVILDNLSNSSQSVLQGFKKILGYCPEFYEGDIRDAVILEMLFQKYSFDGVIHFAGLKSVGESTKHISQYQENNVSGSIQLFSVMQQYGVKKIIFSSSATVYRSDNISPVTEECPVGTTNPYGTTKLVIEKLLEDYARHVGWSVANLRYFNPIGAHPSGCIGEVPKGVPDNLLPYILDVAIGKRENVTIYGNDYPTPDGTGVRDYIDVNDLVDAHVCVYEDLRVGCAIYNIGTGKGTSVLEMIHVVEEISGKEISFLVGPRRSGDLASVFASVEKISTEKHWYAKRTFEESIRSAWNFISHTHHK